jgi:hypothetical protein
MTSANLLNVSVQVPGGSMDVVHGYAWAIIDTEVPHETRLVATFRDRADADAYVRENQELELSIVRTCVRAALWAAPSKPDDKLLRATIFESTQAEPRV